MQTSYSANAPTGFLGLPTEDWTKYIDTVIPTVSVKIGKLLTADLTAGAVRNKAKLPAAAGDVAAPLAMGIVIWDPTREGGSDWPALRPAPVMRKGRIWVTAEGAITRWSHPFVRIASGAGGTELGSFRGDADTATATQVTHTIAITDAGAGELVLVEIDI